MRELGTREAPAVVVTRFSGTELDVLGVLAVEGQLVAVTLEDAWRNNEPNRSCIPLGRYFCRRVVSPTKGETFTILGVPNRSLLLFHSGNDNADTEGCILTGAVVGPCKPNGARTILGSRLARARFMRALEGVDAFWLEVTRMPDTPAVIAAMCGRLL